MEEERERKRLVVGYSVSGACALVYQVVWSHALVDQLGASGTTLLVVLCSFIGGLGIGSALSPAVYRAAARRFGGHGLKNYGRTELAVTLATLALFGLTRISLRPVIGRFPYRPHLVGGLALLEPTVLYQTCKVLLAVASVGLPCVLMGLTFPYLCSLHATDRTFPSRLYAANTLGACVAALVTEFWGIGAVGYLGCLSIGAFGTAALGLYFLRWPERSPGPEPDPAAASSSPGMRSARPSLLPGAVSGLLCGGLQALGFAYVRLELGPTRGAFALLSTFAILGIWLASSFVHRFRPGRTTLLGLAWSGVAWIALLWRLEPGASLRLLLAGVEAPAAFTPYGAALLAVTAAVGLFLLLPYTVWSTLLPSLCDRLQERGVSVSLVYGLNTISFLAGVLAFGWALPNVNVFFAARLFGLAAVIGLVLLTVCPWDQPVSGGWLAVGAAALVVGGVVVPRGVPARLLRDLGGGSSRLLAYRGTAQSFYWVRTNPDGSRSLMFDGYSMSGTSRGGQTYMRVMAHLPLLLHPAPRRALLICFGVGGTADAIRRQGHLERLDIVDLNPSVYLLNRYFSETNGDVLHDPRVRLFCDDGRQFVKLVEEEYDLVTMEPPPPLQPGIARLYSAEYYAAVKARLAPGGLVSQWLPESQMDVAGADLIVATFVRAFRYTLLSVGFGRDLILIGSDSPIDLARLPPRLSAEPAVSEDLARFGLTSPARLLATILRLPASMEREWGRALPIEDGFSSLEAIQVNSPVQQGHPRSTFRPLKPALRADRGAVGAALRAVDPALAAEVDRLQADPSADLAYARLVPAWYLR